MMAQHFGKNLGSQIAAKGYSVRGFSRVYAAQAKMKPEVARRSIYRWIGNENPPEISTVRKLAAALEVRTQDLTGDEDEEPSLAARLFERAVVLAVQEQLRKVAPA